MLWAGLGRHIYGYLDAVTLEDVVSRNPLSAESARTQNSRLHPAGEERMNRIYLDYNATHQIRPGVQEAVAQALGLGNPSAVHAEGRRARARSDRRAQVWPNFAGRTGRSCVHLGGTEACKSARA